MPITSCDTTATSHRKHNALPPQGRKGFRGTTLILAIAQHDERCGWPALWPDHGGRPVYFRAVADLFSGNSLS